MILITWPVRDVVVVFQMQEVAGERGGYLHGRGALDSDDLLYLKEQMEAEQDAERLLRRTEKRAFAAFKKAATLADSSPASLPLPLRLEPKPKSTIRYCTYVTLTHHCPSLTLLCLIVCFVYVNRQQDLLNKIVQVKPKKPKLSDTTSSPTPTAASKTQPDSNKNQLQSQIHTENPVKGLLGLAYASSDDEDSS